MDLFTRRTANGCDCEAGFAEPSRPTLLALEPKRENRCWRRSISAMSGASCARHDDKRPSLFGVGLSRRSAADSPIHVGGGGGSLRFLRGCSNVSALTHACLGGQGTRAWRLCALLVAALRLSQATISRHSALRAVGRLAGVKQPQRAPWATLANYATVGPAPEASPGIVVPSERPIPRKAAAGTFSMNSARLLPRGNGMALSCSSGR
jgi:hypothetical protein